MRVIAGEAEMNGSPGGAGAERPAPVLSSGLEPPAAGAGAPGAVPPRASGESRAPAGPPSFSAVVLAAGLSRRMGADNKLLLPVGGRPLIRAVVERVLDAGFVEVVVVLGYEAAQVRAALGALPVRCAHNPAFESGQQSSVRVGLGALVEPVDAVTICLGDQPLLESADLLAERAAFAARPHGSILVPFRGERRGNPVILDRRSVSEALARGTNFGCRRFIDESPERVYRWQAPNDHFVRDVDEPADYQALLARPPS